MKLADLQTPLQPHQQRVIDKLRASHGVLVAHGVGSGKTLASIAAADSLGLPIDAIVPAPLVANYHKEMAKHLGEEPDDTRVRSYEKAVRDKDVRLDALAVMDEAHRARNAGTQVSRHVAGEVAKAKYRLLLTGTPVYNQPYDIAPLLNTAAGRTVLPEDPAAFKRHFIAQESVDAPLLQRIKARLVNHNMKGVTRSVLKNRQDLVQAARGYVDVYSGGGANFPDRVDETHSVPLSAHQHDLYNFHSNAMPWYLKAKIGYGLPLDKKESKELNAFQGALRQVSNTPRPYMEGMTDEEEESHTPKIQLMARHLGEMRAKDPNFRGVVYSNYLGAGLNPMSRALTKAGIPHHVFTGEVSKRRRDQMVRDYNEGHAPVLLLSGAGAEGLDLKGTKSIQLMEPHWNESRINQVIGRGIRYKSHDHLPPEERKVRVMRYTSTLPSSWTDKLPWSTPTQSVEQYMKTTSDEKDRLGTEIGSALQEASDYGPLRKTKLGAVNLQDRARVATFRHYGLSKLADDEERPWYKNPLITGAGAAAVGGVGIYGAMRRKGEGLHPGAERSKGKYTAFTPEERPDSKLKQLWDRIRIAGGGEVRYRGEHGAVDGAARYHDPRQVQRSPADVMGGDVDLTNFDDRGLLSANKMLEYKFLNQHAPGTMGKSESVGDILLARGHTSIDPETGDPFPIHPDKVPEALRDLQTHLREKYRDGFLLKDINGLQSSGSFPSEVHDFNQLLQGYHAKPHLRGGGAAMSETQAMEQARHRAKDPHYAGRVLDEMALDPGNIMVQERLPLAQLSGLRARLNKALGAANNTREVRVHVENGVAHPSLSTSRFDILGGLFDRQNHRDAAAYAQSVIDKLPEGHRQGTYGMDIAPLQGGGYKVIETNPSARSGLMMGSDPRMGINAHRYYTGQYSPMVAGAGAVLGAGALGAGAAGATLAGDALGDKLNQ